MRSAVLIGMSLAVLAGLPASASDCPGNPDALGTSRVLAIDPADYAVVGTMQYHNSLPLADKEVVLTFDDGPLPPNTNVVLDLLAAECVKANYFLVGSMARAHPDLVRRIHREGHVIGTHTQTHPRYFHKLSAARMRYEVDQGIASAAEALGDRSAVAPFFRIPGLRRSDSVEDMLVERGLVTWSADFPVDDWKHISPTEEIKRAMSRLDAKGKGIILMHDIQRSTAAAMPELLRRLKAGGYKIVQVVARVPAIDDPKAPIALRASLKADGTRSAALIMVKTTTGQSSPLHDTPAGSAPPASRTATATPQGATAQSGAKDEPEAGP